MSTRQQTVQERNRDNQHPLDFAALGKITQAIVGDKCTVSVDNGKIVIDGVVTKDFALSIDGYSNGNLDRWQQNFLEQIKILTGEAAVFDSDKLTVTLSNCKIQLPFEANQVFRITFNSDSNLEDLANNTNTKLGIAIFEKYIQTLSVATQGVELEGSFKAPSKLDQASDRVLRKLGFFGQRALQEAQGAIEDFGNSEFGKNVRARVKGTLDRVAGPLGNQKINLEDLAYKAKDKILFESIFGQVNPVNELQNIVKVLNSKSEKATPELKRAATPSLLILTGGPGLGKTRSIDAFIQASGSPAYVLSGNSLMSQWYGATENMTAHLLRELKEKAAESPTGVVILKVDEGETKLQARGPNTHEASARMLSMFLENIEPDSGVLVILATNLPGNLDGAMISRTVKELQYSNLSSETIAQALMYRIKIFAEKNEFELENNIDQTKIASLLEGEDGRVIDRVLMRFTQLSILDDEEQGSNATFRITTKVLSDAIQWSTDAAK